MLHCWVAQWEMHSEIFFMSSIMKYKSREHVPPIMLCSQIGDVCKSSEPIFICVQGKNETWSNKQSCGEFAALILGEFARAHCFTTQDKIHIFATPRKILYLYTCKFFNWEVTDMHTRWWYMCSNSLLAHIDRRWISIKWIFSLSMGPS